jgi:hypothetical protein
MVSVPEIDEKLWFTMKAHCEKKHYLSGNPHTFRGRMLGWCPQKETSFFVSKNEMDKCSPEASYRIDGFLSGSEAEPPLNSDGDADFESREYKNRLNKIEKFKETGFWED